MDVLKYVKFFMGFCIDVTLKTPMFSRLTVGGELINLTLTNLILLMLVAKGPNLGQTSLHQT